MQPSDLYERTLSDIKAVLDTSDATLEGKYVTVLQSLLISLITPVQSGLLKRYGQTIQTGPFAGMLFHTQVLEGCYIPKLLGCYESELHPVLQSLQSKSYARIINIGCADGYYAVGLARLFPNASIYAFDTNEKAQNACIRLAMINQVQDRLQVAGAIQASDLEQLLQEGGKTLIMCDIEGGEFALLNPAQAPRLKGVDLIVELHHHLLGKAALQNEFLKQYEPSHTIDVISHGGRNPNQFPALQNLGQLEQFLALCEFRPCPTPWAVLKSKHS